MGSKARLRKWLVEKFPKNGKIYFEPFSGVANVYFLSANVLDFNYWWLNDRYSHKFLYELKSYNSYFDSLFPDKITPELKKFVLENRESQISVLLENVLTFGGKGYSAGFTSDIDDRYNKDHFLKRVKEAKKLLEKTTLTCADWKDFDYSCFGREDFLYFDPPYYETKACYPNIDHKMLIDVLNTAKYRWALSGYDNALYTQTLWFKNKYQIERNSEIKSSNKRERVSVIETLWTNY